MRSIRNACFLTAGVLLAVAPGCGPADEVACAPVRGTVMYQSQPLADAMIVFHPLNRESANGQVAAPAESSQERLPVLPSPIAYSDSEGRFAVTSLQAGDGAPPGRYAITVELREARLIGEEMVRDGRNLLPARYASAQTTPLKFEVTPGENEVPTITIE